MPRTVIAAKPVELVLVNYIDETGTAQTQLGVVGDNTVHLIDARTVGMSTTPSPQGKAVPWLRDGILSKLGRKVGK